MTTKANEARRLIYFASPNPATEIIATSAGVLSLHPLNTASALTNVRQRVLPFQKLHPPKSLLRSSPVRRLSSSLPNFHVRLPY